MHVLGVSGLYHDSAACLVRDGLILAAAQEERFTRIKHDAAFPEHAIRFCLERGGIEASELDYVVFYEKPLLKVDRLLETYLAIAPRGFRSFLRAIPTLVGTKLAISRHIDRVLSGYRRRPLFVEHHLSHAASAFFPSPFQRAAVLTLDGVGEWATGTVGFGRDNRVELLREIRFPHSLGLLYSAFTQHLGFKVDSGEYKVMGLAPYGEPVFAQRILSELVDLKEDGSFRLNLDYLGYCTGLGMTGPKFADLFGGPARVPESPLTQRDKDLAASIQAVTEEIVVRCARFAKRVTGARALCLAGGVALNSVANGAVRRQAIFDRLWAQPAAGDAGGALGAALLVWYELLDSSRAPNGVDDGQRGSLLGPSYDDPEEIARAVHDEGAVSTYYEDEDELLDEVVTRLERQEIVGHFHGRMEFGPRALGSRSILADPRSPSIRDAINAKIKFRESFRPLAPAVLRERAAEWFELEPGEDSPYMLLVVPVREDKAGDLPGITHVDRSARVQTVDARHDGRFHRLLRRFEERTGCPALINTSLNVRGEPLACRPVDALRCFLGTGMDALVLGNHLLSKDAQPRSSRVDPDVHRARFQPD